MTLEAMVKAVNEGKTVVNDLGSKVFMDLQHEYGPYIYQFPDGLCENFVAWSSHDDYKILEEPKQEQITDRYELMELCRKWEKEGKRFLVTDDIDMDLLPWQFYPFTLSIEKYHWTALDETGHPTGEPQKFMREVEE